MYVCDSSVLDEHLSLSQMHTRTWTFLPQL